MDGHTTKCVCDGCEEMNWINRQVRDPDNKEWLTQLQADSVAPYAYPYKPAKTTKKVEVKQYKCRVECDIDIERMRNKLKVKGVIDGDEWVFNDRRTLKTIRKLMGECIDCHVAQQTVQPIADYTGVRVYQGE